MLFKNTVKEALKPLVSRGVASHDDVKFSALERTWVQKSEVDQ